MLYIFLVDTGTMMTFDVSFALESVTNLKNAISHKCSIPVDKQVLLVSGGENLEASSRVGNYSAGTDTSPIFLFSKSAIESSTPPSPSIDYGSDVDLTDQVEGCKDMEPTYHAVVARVQLAQQFHDHAKEIARECEKLVHDQHLQHQGWAAVVANLEDLAGAFASRAEAFQNSYKEYLESRNSYVELLQDFSHDLQMLSRIPVLPALLGEACEKRSDGAADFITLLEWISSKDNQSSLEHIADQCIRGLETLVSDIQDELRNEIQEALRQADNLEFKEIGGVGERLYGLEQLMCEAKRIVSEQGALAQALLQNQARAANLRDKSILPDLCASHQQQLQLLLCSHQKLRDIRHRCAVAKRELSANIHARLRWVVYVEKNIYDIDNKLVIYHENLKRLKRHLEVIQQIHRAPKIYLAAVVEVVRRHSFTKTYLQWSTSLAQQSSELHKKEVSTRQEFNSQITNHFLQSLFPGMEDFPPSFATKAPEVFDANLPKLFPADIEMLKQVLPDLSNLLKVPSIDPMPRVSLAMTDSAFESDIPSSSRAPCASPVSSTTSGHHTQQLEHAEPVNCDAKPHGLSRTASSASDPSPTQECMSSSLDSANAKLTKSSIHSETINVTTKRADMPPRQQDKCTPPIAEEKDERGSDTDEFEQLCPEVKADSAEDVMKGEFKSNRTRLNLVTDSLIAMHEMVQRSQQQLRGEMNTLKEQVLHEREFVLEELLALAIKLKNAVEKVKVQAHEDQNQAVEEAITKVQSENQAILQMCQKQLEAEVHKLNEAHKEINIYQEQLRQQNVAIEALKQEMDSRVSEIKMELESENKELERRLTLEHELELVNLRDELEQKYECKQQEINTLKETLAEKDSQIEQLQNEMKQLENDLRKSFENEREEITKSVEAKFREREQSAVEWALQEQEQCHKNELEGLKEEMEQLKKDLKASQDEKVALRSQFEESLMAAAEKHEDTIKKQTVQFEEIKQKELAELEEKMEQKLKNEVESLRSRFKLAMSTSAMERSPSDSSLEKVSIEKDVIDIATHDSILARLQKQFHEEKARSIEEAIEEEHSKQQMEMQKILQEKQKAHEASLTKLRIKFKADHEDEIQLLKAVFAEREKKLNESFSRKIRDLKDMVKDYQEKEVNLREQLTRDRAYIEKLLQGKIDPNSHMSQALDEALQREREAREMWQKAEKELAEFQQRHEPRRLSDQFGMQDLSTSIVPLKDSSMKTSTIVQDPRIADLESRLLSKDIEITTLRQKLMQVSVSEPARAVNSLDKISLSTCDKDDLVLVCFDEVHANYIAYQTSSVLYFINSECLDALGLKLNSEVKKFAIGVVVDKEFCEARKASNRFKVPVGTRFYRIRVKPWEKPAFDPRSFVSRSSDRSRDGSQGGGRSRSESAMTSSAIDKTSTSSNRVFSPHHQLYSSVN